MKKRPNKGTKAYQKWREKVELKKLDKTWSINVRNEFNNQCAVCKNKDHVQAHHLIGRHYKPTRHLLVNGVSLCSKCHKFGPDSAHRNPLVFLLWYTKNYPNRFTQLVREYNKSKEIK